jgi:TPR repeat protein
MDATQRTPPTSSQPIPSDAVAIHEEGLNAFNAGDYVRAEQLMKLSAEKGDPSANFSLGCMYYDGYPGIPQDEQKAIDCFIKSAKEGCVIAKCQLNCIYSLKGWEPYDLQINICRVQFYLGYYYLEGYRTLQKNDQRAVECFKLCASQRDNHGLEKMGEIYLHGLYGTPQNLEQAAHYLTTKSVLGEEPVGFVHLSREFFTYYGYDRKDEVSKMASDLAQRASNGDRAALNEIIKVFEANQQRRDNS